MRWISCQFHSGLDSNLANDPRKVHVLMNTQGLFGLSIEIDGKQVNTVAIEVGTQVIFLRSDLLTNRNSCHLNEIIELLIGKQHELVDSLEPHDCILVGINGQAYYLKDARFPGTVCVIGAQEIRHAAPGAIVNVVQTLDALIECLPQLPQWRLSGHMHFLPQHPISIK